MKDLSSKIYNIINSYKPSPRVLSLGSRPENVNKANELKTALNSFKQEIKENEPLSVKKLDKLFVLLDQYKADLSSKGKYSTLHKDACDLLHKTSRPFILDYLSSVIAGDAKPYNSSTFNTMLLTLNLPQHNYIQNLSAHLASDPLPRLPGWKPRTTPRKWKNKNWIQASYPILPIIFEEIKFPIKLDPKYRPNLISMKAIREEYKSKKSDSKSSGAPSYTILFESDALQNHNLPCFKNGIVQMASQGNCQEATRREIALLKDYCTDRTQGPASAMSAVDATLARRVFLDDCDLMRLWLLKYDPNSECFDYQYGYLIPKKNQVEACIKLLDDHGEEILANVQQVRIDNASLEDNQWMTQVPCFGFAFGINELYPRSEDEKNVHIPALCQRLLTLQYQAIAQLAVLKSRALGQRIPLLLTPVGAGAFGNPPSAVYKAIASIQSIVEGENVDVVLSIFNRDELKEEYRKIIPFFSLEKTHDEMSQISAGALHNISTEDTDAGDKELLETKVHTSVSLFSSSSSSSTSTLTVIKMNDSKETSAETHSSTASDNKIAFPSEYVFTPNTAENKGMSLISPEIALRLYKAIPNFVRTAEDIKEGNRILQLTAKTESEPKKFPQALKFCKISFEENSVFFLSEGGYCIKNFAAKVHLSNIDLIAIVDKFIYDTKSSIGDDDSFKLQLSLAEYLITLFQSYDYDSDTERSIIDNAINQLMSKSFLIMTKSNSFFSSSEQPNKFKGLLDKLQKELNARLKPVQAKSTPLFAHS